MPITITVTQEDIERWKETGKRGECKSCPIWQAIQRIPELKGFNVGLDHIYDGEFWEVTRSALLPPEAVNLSRASWFMQYDSIKPLTFEVSL